MTAPAPPVLPHLQIVLTRLEALRSAILEKDLEAIEFQFDRVLRAVQKTRRLVESDQTVALVKMTDADVLREARRIVREAEEKEEAPE